MLVRPREKAGLERRSAARKHKEALFYDSGERRRMWLLVGTLVFALLGMVAVVIIFGAMMVSISESAAQAKIVKEVVHSDGSVTFAGELVPLNNDATKTTMIRNATEDIELLFTVTALDQDKRNKRKMVHRTAAGTSAEHFVNDTFSSMFSSYTQGHFTPEHIDCQPEGTWTGPAATTRMDCYYVLTPVDRESSGINGVSGVRYESRIDLSQSRGTTDEDVLYDNPDEIYTTFIDNNQVQ